MFIKGVIQEVIKASGLLGGPYFGDAYGMRAGPALPFMEIEGNSLVYNREVDASAMAVWHAPLDSWAADNLPTWSQQSTALKIVGAQSQIDNFMQQTRSNINDQTAAVIASASKALAFAYENECVYGATSTSHFDGLHVICNATAAQKLAVATAADNATVPMTTAMIDTLCDMVRPAPDILLMNRTAKNQLSQFSRTKTSPVTYLPQQFGQTVTLWNGIPIVVTDFITNSEDTDSNGFYTAKTGGITTSIFALKFGERNVCGLQNGGIQKQNIGEMESADSKLWRLKWYCGLAVFSTVSAACLSNIATTGTTSLVIVA